MITDGAANCVMNLAGCGGVFCSNNLAVLGAFALHNIGPHSALAAELHACIQVINVALEKQWPMLWIEIDSKLVTQAFRSPSIVP